MSIKYIRVPESFEWDTTWKTFFSNLFSIKKWNTPTFSGTWADSGNGRPVAYRIDPFGVVHLRGEVGSGTSGTAVFTLPAGFRPTGLCTFKVKTAADGAGDRVEVASTGVVTVYSSGGSPSAWLDQITFEVY